MDISIWSDERILTAKWLADSNALQLGVSFILLQRISGGSIESELKLLAVTPMLVPSDVRVVIIVTPVAKLPSARRNALGLNSFCLFVVVTFDLRVRFYCVRQAES